MTSSYCWITNENIQRELEALFQDIDREFSRYYELRPETSEPTLDGRLSSKLEIENLSEFEVYVERIANERRRQRKNPLTLTFHVNHITRRERSHGADIGLVLHVNLPNEYELTKATLVQSKRLYPSTDGRFSEDCIYQEMFRNRDTPQWQRMLEQSPASVYFLYNPEKLLLNTTIRNLGTRVIPAQRIAGISQQSFPSFSAGEAYRTGKTLSKWLVEDFICCAMGDTRREVITTALGQNSDFPVWNTIKMTISSDITEPSLWSQQ